MLLGLDDLGYRMNVGKTLFAQVMEYVPWKTFGRIIDRHNGDAGVRTLSCADLFRVMAFAQLTWRESLRDIEVCLTANQAKLFHMGLKSVPARSTLSDALNLRDWRIYHALAMRLITRARDLYTKEPLNIDLDATVYALDSTTIDLCLSLFNWAPFRSTKAAVKMHTLLDLRGAIPAFIHISDGKMHDVNVLDFLPIEAGAFYVMDRGYLDFARLYKLHQVGAFFVTRAKRGMDARRVYSAVTDRDSGVICDQTIAMNGFYVSKSYPEHLRRIRFKDPHTGKTLVFLTNNTALPPLTIAALYKNRWQVELFFKWIKQHLRIKRFLGTSENAVKTQIWCAVSTYVLIAIVKKELQLDASLYTLLQILSVSVFEKSQLSSALRPSFQMPETPLASNQLNLFNF
jgi:transposase